MPRDGTSTASVIRHGETAAMSLHEVGPTRVKSQSSHKVNDPYRLYATERDHTHSYATVDPNET